MTTLKLTLTAIVCFYLGMLNGEVTESQNPKSVWCLAKYHRIEEVQP